MYILFFIQHLEQRLSIKVSPIISLWLRVSCAWFWDVFAALLLSNMEDLISFIWYAVCDLGISTYFSMQSTHLSARCAHKSSLLFPRRLAERTVCPPAAYRVKHQVGKRLMGIRTRIAEKLMSRAKASSHTSTSKAPTARRSSVEIQADILMLDTVEYGMRQFGEIVVADLYVAGLFAAHRGAPRSASWSLVGAMPEDAFVKTITYLLSHAAVLATFFVVSCALLKTLSRVNVLKDVATYLLVVTELPSGRHVWLAICLWCMSIFMGLLMRNSATPGLEGMGRVMPIAGNSSA
jgi:hypothetical protein